MIWLICKKVYDALTIQYISVVMMLVQVVKWKWKPLSRVRLFANPMDYIVRGILKARILEWVAVPFSRAFSQPRDWTQVSCIAGRSFTSWAIGEAQEYWRGQPIPSPADLPDPGIKLKSPALQGDPLPTELNARWINECYWADLFFQKSGALDWCHPLQLDPHCSFALT